MKINKKIIKIAFVFVIILLAIFYSGSITRAACGDPSYCDAPAGECSTTANGGNTIVIGSFQTVTRQCQYLKLCTPCDKDENPYCKDYCSPVEQCTDFNEKVVTTTCTDTIWASCCTPGIPVGSCGDGSCTGTESCLTCESDCGACQVLWCGDGSCNNGESQSSCAADCGSSNVCGDGTCTGSEDCSSCAPDCGACFSGPTCGDGSCNGSIGESCDNCSSDCGSCTSCGDGSCNGSESCSNCSTDCGACLSCGDGFCNGSETCSSCAIDCGACGGDFCGDNICNGFERCDTCSFDCGACEENAAWFQISAGNVGSANSGQSSIAIQSNITDTADCVEPFCIRSLIMQDPDLTSLTDGFAVVGSGIIDANGLINGQRSENIYSSNTTKSRYQEKYEFFYRNSGLASAPASDFVGSDLDALKPLYNANDIVYFQNGDLRIGSPWSVAAGETYVIFIDGNLTLADGDGASDQLIDVANGGFIAFIVSGDITIDESLGNSTLSDTTPNVEGVFIADGTFTVASRGTAAGGDDRFVGEGSFIGWNGVNLNRDFSDGSDRSLENNDKAVELFIYRPDFIVTMPDIMLVPIRIWQETN